MTEPVLPLISVVIPARDAQDFVAEAIDSVLAQSHPAVECIVVDDSSSDGTADAVRAYGHRLRLVSQSHQGVSAARNHGATLASGDLLAFLDADDVWHPERLEQMFRALAGEPGCEAVLCASRVVDRAGRELGFLRLDPHLELSEILLCRAGLVSASSNLLITRACFEAVEGFDARLSTAADWALLLRVVDGHRLRYVDEPLVLYRRHGANMSRGVEAMEHDMVLVYDELFAARRDDPSLQRIRRRAYANLRRVIAGSYYAQGDLGGLVRNTALSAISHPAALGYFLAYPARRLRSRRARLGPEGSYRAA